MSQRIFSYPKSFEEPLTKALASYKLTLQDSKALAKSVLTLSDYFINKPEAFTPWHESWAQIAYLCYYLPLNSARLQAVFIEADKRQFFDGIETVIDFGAGLATASMTLAETHKLQFQLIERAQEPQKILEKFFPAFHDQQTLFQWHRALSASKIKNPAKSLALFSYSLTELVDIPDWASECEALMLVEPSTQDDGRKLLELRQKLLDRGYHVWAPCTHTSACPLLTQSKSDWCHDRIHFDAPVWFQKMEEQLPMKNRTLTMSYLLMRKTAPATLSVARVVGDHKTEKGKDRQLVCRGPEREFLSWLHKSGVHQEIPRGVLVKIPSQIEKLSNELRVTEQLELF